MAKVKSHAAPILEKGDIYFVYRPRVDTDEVHGVRDVERMYIVLKPQRQTLFRLIIVGRKKLPDPDEHDRFWAFVWRVFKDRAALQQELREETYQTKTRGTHHLPPARPAAEGIYALARHDGHTHLAYALELPEAEGPAERELNIRREASYIVAVKNPEAPAPPGLEPGAEAKFPQRLMEKFRGRRFVPVDPADFLNYEGAQLILIGTREDPETELGIEFKPDREDEHTADALKDLKLPREIAREPLFEGKWK